MSYANVTFAMLRSGNLKNDIPESDKQRTDFATNDLLSFEIRNRREMKVKTKSENGNLGATFESRGNQKDFPQL